MLSRLLAIKTKLTALIMFVIVILSVLTTAALFQKLETKLKPVVEEIAGTSEHLHR